MRSMVDRLEFALREMRKMDAETEKKLARIRPIKRNDDSIAEVLAIAAAKGVSMNYVLLDHGEMELRSY